MQCREEIEPTCLSDFEREAVVKCNTHSIKNTAPDSEQRGRPTEEKLTKIHSVLSKTCKMENPWDIRLKSFLNFLEIQIVEYAGNLQESRIVMPDQDAIIDDEEKAPIAAKLALLVGIMPRNSLSDLTCFNSSNTIDNFTLPFKPIE
ncbi:hypothetical protein EVAR_78755_1 [Eumeta japonica]|uniref:Uncharacterized protein n=1 Tax=Eumeta variegata TaxID=151549 RepID=A0A4C1T485_EUMVA|nr:hypothetical protein EVAR_78755_1 [Eumeta japonica]